MRTLAQDFSASTRDKQDDRWKLRLLPHPLYRYESTDPDVVDGALFTLVSSAGTDPEIIFLIEARKTESEPQWVYGVARFSDMNLWLTHKAKEVWSSIRSETNTFNHDAKHRFRFYQDRVIPDTGGSEAQGAR